MSRISVMLLAMASVLGVPAVSAATAYDSFSTPMLWDAFSYGKGRPSTLTANGQLVVSIPATSSGSSFGAGYTSLCQFRGDFDVQVDYSLLNFPASNGVRVGLVAGNVISRAKWGSGAETMRISRGITETPSGIEVYATNIGYDCCHDMSTSDAVGKFRVTRTQNTLSGYYYDTVAGQWVLIGSNTVKLGDTPIEIGSWSHDGNFSGQAVRVAFDNVVVNKGTLVGASCPIR